MILARALGDDPAAPAILGDLHEDYVRIARERGERAARRWYVREALLLSGGRLARALLDPPSARTEMHDPGALRPFLQDGAYALRTLRRSPGFSLFTAAVVGLGVGATTAVFSVLKPLLIAPLPFADPAALIWIENDGNPGDNSLSAVTSRTGVLRDFRTKARSFLLRDPLPRRVEGPPRRGGPAHRGTGRQDATPCARGRPARLCRWPTVGGRHSSGGAAAPDPDAVTAPRPTGPRWLSLLLRLYPRAYRARYAEEMVAFHAQERAGARGGPGFWLRVTLDHAAAAWRVRRAARAGRWVRMGEDLGSAIRSLGRAPAFTTFAVLTLALGVGATAAVFTVLDRVVLRPLPYADSERMAFLGTRFRHQPDRLGPLSPALVAALEEAPGPTEAIAAVGGGPMIFTGRGDPARIVVTRPSAGYFDLFEMRAAAGRLFTPAEHGAGALSVALLSHAFWVERYGGSAEAVGSTVFLDGAPHTVVGVLDPKSFAPGRLDGGGGVWVPLGLGAEPPSRGTYFLAAAARLRPGATLAEVGTHLERVWGEVYPPGEVPDFVLGVGVDDLRTFVVGDIGGVLGRVLAAVALLLVIACVNVASLLLTRGTERARELAVRSALGASRARLLRHLLAESLVLALAGGAVGGLLALGAVDLFRRYAPGGIPRLVEASVDGRSFAFALALAIATVTVFGLLPALRAARKGGQGVAGLAGRATATRREGRLRGTLVAAETALAVVLVVGSGLLAHDLVRVATEDPGFEADGLVAMRLSLRVGPMDMDYEGWKASWAQIEEAAWAIPGAGSVALVSELPYTDDGMVSLYTPEGHEDAEEAAFVPTVAVAGDYLGTLGIEMAAGRDFTVAERAGATPVAWVNEAFVRAWWPGEEGVGKRVKSGGPSVEDEATYEVVGVVRDTRAEPGMPAFPTIYLPLALEPWPHMDVLVRTTGEPAALAPALRALVRELDPGLPITGIRTLHTLQHEALARPRFYATLFGGFALVALLLAVVGVYGTTAYATRSRTREIGIRLALGARRDGVVGAVVARTGAVVLGGVAIGLAGAAAGASALADTLLYVAPRDAGTYAAVGASVLAAGVVAAWLPARRAGRVDPVSTLREEA